MARRTRSTSSASTADGAMWYPRRAWKKQIKYCLYNNRASLPSRELGVSSYTTVTSLCEANAIDNLLSKPNATINTCGVIG